MNERKTKRKETERERLERLEREGILKLGTGKIPDEFWESEGPEDPDGLVLEALLKNRREGR